GSAAARPRPPSPRASPSARTWKARSPSPPTSRGAGPRLPPPARAASLPTRVLAAASEGPPLTAQGELIPLVHDKRALAGRATAYVCEARVCALPTSDPAVLKAQLAEVYPLAAAR